ncbi:hypothetical protein CXB51_018818 [Gossypium anomalum]|uniref:Uncharacterized protein n=1 Tax=Gossypium anomalum TaxID=47600 RepID=A0A8J5YW62_9ROSI|nr:hypothetical protein CXB51_018818 [Gossypium anomalum]
MENGFLDKVEDNAAIRIWSEKMQLEKVEEYTALLRCPKIQVDKAYSRAANVPTFVKKLMNITGMSEKWVVAPLGYIDEAVSDLFDRFDKRVTLVPVILAETFRSLNACRRAGHSHF